MPKLSHQEWKFIVWIWLVVIFLSFLPVIIGIIRTPADSIFLGKQSLNGSDLQVYYSNIEQIRDNHFLLKNLFTSEPHTRFIFDPVWLAIGLLAKIFQLSGFWAFQVGRFLTIPFLLLSCYWLVAIFFRDELKRKVAFIFLIFASGFGGFYLQGIANNAGELNFSVDSHGTAMLPIDVWIPEAFTFLSIYNSPHFIVSLIFIVLILSYSILAFEKYRLVYSVLAGIFTFFLFFFHPYHVPTVLAVIGVFILVYTIKERRIFVDYLKHFFVLLIFAAPPILYHWWVLQNFWVRKQHFLQNITLLPIPGMILIGYGLLAPLALIGILSILRNKEHDIKKVFMVSWFFTHATLIFLPFSFQRRLLEGLQLIIAILAVTGLFYLKDILLTTRTRENHIVVFSGSPFWVILFIVLFSFSWLQVLVGDIGLYFNEHRNVYISQGKVLAMQWIRENTKEEDIVISSVESGNLIPAISVRQVYLGHSHQTALSEDKLFEVKNFFLSHDDKTRIDFLSRQGIDYLFFGQEEKAASSFNPAEKNYFIEVFKNDQVSIYKVEI